MCPSLDFAFQGKDMKSLIRRITRGQFVPIPTSYSPDLVALITSLLSVDPAERPSANAVLRLPLIRERITKFLSEQQCQSEFSHTVLHGFQPLSGAPPVVRRESSTPATPGRIKPPVPAQGVVRETPVRKKRDGLWPRNIGQRGGAARKAADMPPSPGPMFSPQPGGAGKAAPGAPQHLRSPAPARKRSPKVGRAGAAPAEWGSKGQAGPPVVSSPSTPVTPATPPAPVVPQDPDSSPGQGVRPRPLPRLADGYVRNLEAQMLDLQMQMKQLAGAARPRAQPSLRPSPEPVPLPCSSPMEDVAADEDDSDHGEESSSRAQDVKDDRSPAGAPRSDREAEREARRREFERFRKAHRGLLRGDATVGECPPEQKEEPTAVTRGRHDQDSIGEAVEVKTPVVNGKGRRVEQGLKLRQEDATSAEARKQGRAEQRAEMRKVMQLRRISVYAMLTTFLCRTAHGPASRAEAQPEGLDGRFRDCYWQDSGPKSWSNGRCANRTRLSGAIVDTGTPVGTSGT
jgi:hypothetical protein